MNLGSSHDKLFLKNPLNEPWSCGGYWKSFSSLFLIANLNHGINNLRLRLFNTIHSAVVNALDTHFHFLSRRDISGAECVFRGIIKKNNIYISVKANVSFSISGISTRNQCAEKVSYLSPYPFFRLLLRILDSPRTISTFWETSHSSCQQSGPLYIQTGFKLVFFAADNTAT